LSRCSWPSYTTLWPIRAAVPRAIEFARSLIERVDVRPGDGMSFELELDGDNGAMVELGSGTTKAAPGGAAVRDLYVRSVKLVAGTGFEPVTFRL